MFADFISQYKYLCTVRKNNLILYDSVEVALKNQIDKVRKKDPKIGFSCFLWHGSDSLTYISLMRNEEGSGSEFVNKLIMNSNRYLLIDKEKLPLIFDYDFKFSSPDLEHIGSFGERELNIVRLNLLFHGYTLSFNLHGKVVRITEKTRGDKSLTKPSKSNHFQFRI